MLAAEEGVRAAASLELKVRIMPGARSGWGGAWRRGWGGE